jgi:hypothetical protein
MRKILAIAVIAVRSAMRSRVVASLLFILGVAMVGLPLTLKGDGTPEGQVQIVLNYTLGFATLILSLASLWAGCAAISTEITEKQIQMIATKPVHRIQIWTGKWLGLMFVNGALLLLAGAAAYGLLHWRTRPGQFPEEDRARLRREVLVARQAVAAPQIDVEPEARQAYEERKARGEVPTNVAPETVLGVIRRQLLNQANTVPAGFAKRWEFDVPAGSSTEDLSVSFRFTASRFGPATIGGLWLAGPPDAPDAHQVPVTNVAGARQIVSLPGELAAARRLVVGFANLDTNGVSVIFDATEGPVLRVRAGEFAPNFARALVVLLAHLAFMSALGVTAGSLFSMPVATFLSLCVVFVLQISGYLNEASSQSVLIPWHEGPNRGANWADEALRLLFKGVHAVATPLQSSDVLGQLSTGQLVGWPTVLQVVLTQGLLAGGLLAAFGAYIFSRRELALHGT